MASSKKHRLAAEINVVPYIDVMLVLLVIFMVTAPLLTQGVKVDLPKVNTNPLDIKQEEPLIVSIKADGGLYLNLGGDQETEKTLEVVKTTIAKVIKAKPNTPVLIWGDSKVAYGKVVDLMAQLQVAGIDQVGLVTEPVE